MKSLRLSALAAASALMLMAPPASANNGDPGYFDDEGGSPFVAPDGSSDIGWSGGSPVFSPSIGLSFNGVSQIDVRSLHSNASLIPPDTNGAVGKTQFMQVTNGAYAVYDKATGTQTALMSDGAFWTAAGQPNNVFGLGFSNGDARVLYDSRSDRWVVTSFAPDLENIQIAISDTSDALGGWKSTSFKAFADGHGTGIADYPTLAIDGSAVYIGTNNFTDTAGACGPYALCGTTMNVIARSDLFGAGAPTVSSLKQFTGTLYDNGNLNDMPFAPQGVNQLDDSDSGRVLGVGMISYGPVSYSITDPGTAGATATALSHIDQTPYASNNLGAQPDGTRNIDTLDDRFSSAVWEVDGKIYSIHTITLPGQIHTSLEYFVIDAATNTVIQKGIIGDGVHDFYQGTITVNAKGQAVIAYNESGYDMNVSLLAQTFNPTSSGALVSSGAPIVLVVSPIGNYHNGSVAGAPANGRQRWGDYAQVTVDPDDPRSFWVTGEYALGYLPDPNTSFSRWGTWIAQINVGDFGTVPEPATWAVMLAGLGIVGASLRRRRAMAA